MLTHPTLDRLKALRLDGMAEAFAELQAQDGAAGLTHAEWLGLLADREAASRETERFDARMRAARLRHVGACETVRNFVPWRLFLRQREAFLEHDSELAFHRMPFAD